MSSDKAKAGRKGKTRSPWSRGPMVKTDANRERMEGWRNDKRR